MRLGNIFDKQFTPEEAALVEIECMKTDAWHEEQQTRGGRIKIMKITGIKKAIGEIKNNSHMHYCAYCNRSTGEVWADFFVDANSWRNYHDTAIVNLRNYIASDDDNPSLTAIYTNAAQRAMAAYND